ncbi:MAG: hypothetical protein ACJ79W_24235, partial [Myxococcales bacterium]
MRRLLAIAALALAAGGCSKAREIPGLPAPSAGATADRNLFGYVLDGAGGFAPLPGSPFASGGKIDDVESL